MHKSRIAIVALMLLAAACGGSSDDTGSPTTAAQAAGADSATTTTAATESTPETTAAPAAETTTTAAAATGGSGDTVAAGPLAAALANSSEVTSARMEGRMTMSGVEDLPAGTEVSMGFSGAFDNEANTSSFVMDLSEMANAAPSDEEIPAEFADLFGEMEVRTIGDTAYMKFGLFAMLGVTTDWISMPADDAGDTASTFGASTSDPTDLLAAFGAADAEVEEIGREQIRGVDTTHYRLTADVAAMMEAADEDARDELEDLGGLPADGTFPVDFWVGDDGNIYRFSFSVDGTIDPSSGFESMEMVWEMYDYGVDVDITAPPADQVTDGSSLPGLITG